MHFLYVILVELTTYSKYIIGLFSGGQVNRHWPLFNNLSESHNRHKLD